MKNKIYFLIIIFILAFSGCTNNNDDITIDDIIYLEEDSSFSFKTYGDTIFFAVEVWLKNNTNSKINFSFKIIFDDPILSRELGKEVFLGEEINFTPLVFTIEPGKKSLYGGSYKIDKSHLSGDEINSLTNNVKIMLIDDNGYERIIKK